LVSLLQEWPGSSQPVRVILYSQVRMEGWLRLARGCMALSLRSLKAMASIVRSSVRTKSGTEQVAEPSSDRAMRLNLSPEQADPPSSYSFQACSFFSPSGWRRPGRLLHPPTLCRAETRAFTPTPAAKSCPYLQGWDAKHATCAEAREPSLLSRCGRVARRRELSEGPFSEASTDQVAEPSRCEAYYGRLRYWSVRAFHPVLPSPLS